MLVSLWITPSHYHHYADLSEGIEHACQAYTAECVSKIKTILSIIFCSIYGAVCLHVVAPNFDFYSVSINRQYSANLPHEMRSY